METKMQKGLHNFPKGTHPACGRDRFEVPDCAMFREKFHDWRALPLTQSWPLGSAGSVSLGPSVWGVTGCLGDRHPHASSVHLTESLGLGRLRMGFPPDLMEDSIRGFVAVKINDLHFIIYWFKSVRVIELENKHLYILTISFAWSQFV